jgi:hypothetical protein
MSIPYGHQAIGIAQVALLRMPTFFVSANGALMLGELTMRGVEKVYYYVQSTINRRGREHNAPILIKPQNENFGSRESSRH